MRPGRYVLLSVADNGCGMTDEVRALVLSPDGRAALSGGADRALRLWDLGAGKLVRVFRGHASTVRSLALAADGLLALATSGDGALFL